MILSNPLFSIIVPVYDRTQKLRESINSLLNQSFDEFEIILVTDGSPQATLDVIDELEIDPRVRVFKYAENSGNACRGRNRGIDLARGKYICFHDSDDIAHPERLARTKKTYEKTNAGGVYGPTGIICDGTREIQGIYNGQILDPPEFSFEILKQINLMMTCSVSVKRSHLLAFGGFRANMRYREDHELWLRLATNGVRWARSPEILCYYRVHSGNAELILGKNDEHWFEQALFWHTKAY